MAKDKDRELPLRNLRFFIRYRGEGYHGYQVQKGLITVAEAFQNAAEEILGVRDPVIGCSRTDSGVHALRFCLTMKTRSDIPCEGMLRAMNVHLPPDIAVLSCEEVPLDFHPRYDAKGKEYRYLIRNSRIRDPFLEGRALLYPKRLDTDKMDRAAAHFVGTHDFKSLCGAQGTAVEDTVRTVTRCDVTRDGDLVTVTVAGDGFLYNMVRIITGTLLRVSEGKFTEDDIDRILEAKDRRKAGPTAPACGLYLADVFYD